MQKFQDFNFLRHLDKKPIIAYKYGDKFEIGWFNSFQNLHNLKSFAKVTMKKRNVAKRPNLPTVKFLF